MARFHATPNGNIPFTPEEEAEADRLEAEYNAGALDRAKTNKINAIDLDTQSKILAIASENKQRNLLATGLALTKKLSTVGLTSQEQADLDSIELVWQGIEALLKTGNDKKALVESATSIADVDAI